MTLNHVMATRESGWTILVRFLVGLIVIMIVALISTKLPILLGHDVWMFHPPADVKRLCFWSTMHESRADLTMLPGCIYFLIVGAGKWSLDHRMALVRKAQRFEKHGRLSAATD